MMVLPETEPVRVELATALGCWPTRDREVCCGHAARVPIAYSAVVMPRSPPPRSQRKSEAGERVERNSTRRRSIGSPGGGVTGAAASGAQPGPPSPAPSPTARAVSGSVDSGTNGQPVDNNVRQRAQSGAQCQHQRRGFRARASRPAGRMCCCCARTRCTRSPTRYKPRSTSLCYTWLTPPPADRA